MRVHRIGLTFILWSVGAASLYGAPKCPLDLAPVKLPEVASWRVALACSRAHQQSSPEWSAARSGIERAWRNYLDEDLLASRVELGKWLPELLEHGDLTDVALALSIGKLESVVRSGTSLADSLTEARPSWREQATLSSWVNLFDGAVAERNRDASQAGEYWTAALSIQDAPLQVRGLAQLGLAEIALNSETTALTHLEAAQQAFDSAGDARGVAAVLVLRARIFSAFHHNEQADSAEKIAESYCRQHQLADGVLESLLAASDAALESGNQQNAAKAWARAEDAALHSGLISVRVLTPNEFVQLKQFSQRQLSLPKAREYFKWAWGSRNLVLIESSARAMSMALKQIGQEGASGWYDIMGDDAADFLAKLPTSTRVLHAALIDYGLLQAGVNPASRQELFVGTDYRALCRQLIAGMGRTLPLLPGDEPEELKEVSKVILPLADRSDEHRVAGLEALSKADGKRAATEFGVFFKSVQPLMDQIADLGPKETASTSQAAEMPDDISEVKSIYAAGLLDAWSMHSPPRLRNILSALEGKTMPVDVPLLLPAANPSKSRFRPEVNAMGGGSGAEMLRAAIALGRAPERRSWPRLVARSAAQGGIGAVSASAFGVEPDHLNEAEAAQFQIAYASQLALAINGELRHVALGGKQPFEWFMSKLKRDSSVQRDVQQASQFGLMMRLLQMAYMSTDSGAAQLAKDPYFRMVIAMDPEPPDFDSLAEDSDSSPTTPEDDSKEKPEKDLEESSELHFPAMKSDPGFLRNFEFAVWSIGYPVLLDSVFGPEPSYLDKAMSKALVSLAANQPHIESSLPPQLAQELGDLEKMKRQIVLDLALSALAGKRYHIAIARLLSLEGMAPPPTTLERVQLNYVIAMCYRGLGDARQEEQLLRDAADQLESLRRSVATRNASLRLRDLRQLIEEEYLSALYRRGDSAAMTRAIASYRLASVLPVAILASAPHNPLAEELETLKDTYHTLSVGTENSPVTRQDYRELLKLFGQPEKLPAGDPTLNAIEQATYLVTNELYAQDASHRERKDAIRPAAPGELLILQAVGHTGVYTVTIDDGGRTSAYFRYLPIGSLQALCESFENALQGGAPSDEVGTQLYDKLLAYLPEISGKKRLSILADGPLQNLPWAALPIPSGKYLIEKYEVGILSGARPVSKNSVPVARRQLLAITNPEMEKNTDDQLAPVRSGMPIIPLVGADANLAKIRAGLTDADAVYISTHGQSDYLRPDYSFLELTGGQRLYSLDLGDLDFSERQLLLSACDTRTGITYGGEEEYGLADAFLARNASTVVATRWQVEAPGARAFSEAFYKSLNNGTDYTSATTLAARELIERQGSKWNAPRHWAAFEPVTRFFDAERTAALSTRRGSVDASERVRITDLIDKEHKQAQLEEQQLTAKVTALNAELTAVKTKTAVEEAKSSILYAQVTAGRQREKRLSTVLKAATSNLAADPAWKPSQHFHLTVSVQDESGKGIPGALASAEDVGTGTVRTASTNREGHAVFYDMTTAEAYHISVDAKGLAMANFRAADLEDFDVWFADAEKVVTMQPLKDVVRVSRRSTSDPKPAMKNEVKIAKVQPPDQMPALQTLLEELNRIEASNDTFPPRVASLDDERSDANDALESALAGQSSYTKEIAEMQTKLAGESAELNALLKSVHLLELQPDRLRISGDVANHHFKRVRARLKLRKTSSGEEQTILSDRSGKFAFDDARPGVEYVLTAEADGYDIWSSPPTVFYSSCSISIELFTLEELKQPRKTR